MFKEFCDFLCHKTEKFITVEINPPHGASIDGLIADIRKLKLHEKVSGFSCTDNPLAKLKMSGVLSSIKVQQAFAKPVIATMSMRDKNKLSLQSTLLGANDFDLRCILALTGDPATMSDQPRTKGVFEGDSTLLLDIIAAFNAGMDYAGKPLKHQPKHISAFAVVNAYAKNPKTLQKKIQKKIKHGAIGIITQPVYDLENAKLLLELRDNANKECCPDKKKAELIFGVFPITKLRTAQFLSAHVPGINVPDIWLEKLRMAHEKGPEEEYKVGFDLSKTLFDDLKALHPKIHLMTANQFEVARDILI